MPFVRWLLEANWSFKVKLRRGDVRGDVVFADCSLGWLIKQVQHVKVKKGHFNEPGHVCKCPAIKPQHDYTKCVNSIKTAVKVASKDVKESKASLVVQRFDYINAVIKVLIWLKETVNFLWFLLSFPFSIILSRKQLHFETGTAISQ